MMHAGSSLISVQCENIFWSMERSNGKAVSYRRGAFEKTLFIFKHCHHGTDATE